VGQFVFLVRYGDSYDEAVVWSQLSPTLVPHQSHTSELCALALDGSGALDTQRQDANNPWPMHSLKTLPKPAPKRHRPFRYIQLPVNMAHPLFGERTFPYAVHARIFVDNQLVTDIPTASLIRCKHPRTSFGFQYQLYGVQDFRRTFQDNPLKVVSVMRGGTEASVDVFFVNVVTKDGGWRATDGSTGLMAKDRTPLVPSAFVQKHFGGSTFPHPVSVVVEIDGVPQATVHPCSIHHDPKAKVYRLRDDKVLLSSYRHFNLAIESWRKMSGNAITMCCRMLSRDVHGDGGGVMHATPPTIAQLAGAAAAEPKLDAAAHHRDKATAAVHSGAARAAVVAGNTASAVHAAARKRSRDDDGGGSVDDDDDDVFDVSMSGDRGDARLLALGDAAPHEEPPPAPQPPGPPSMQSQLQAIATPVVGQSAMRQQLTSLLSNPDLLASLAAAAQSIAKGGGAAAGLVGVLGGHDGGSPLSAEAVASALAQALTDARAAGAGGALPAEAALRSITETAAALLDDPSVTAAAAAVAEEGGMSGAASAGTVLMEAGGCSGGGGTATWMQQPPEPAQAQAQMLRQAAGSTHSSAGSSWAASSGLASVPRGQAGAR